MEGDGPPDLTAVAAGSDIPRGGSRNVRKARMATTMPGAPTAMNAARQLTCSAIQPPSMEPKITPIGAPSQITDMAEARRFMG